jgi:hypothetical protein
MDHEERARRLLERAREGERSHALVRDLDGLAAEVREAGAAELVAEAVYTVLADSPELFVRSYDALFADLASDDEEVRAGAGITFSWLAEHPPEELAGRVPELINLLRAPDELIRGSAVRALRHVAASQPGATATATNALFACLEDDNPWIRGEACFALGHLGDERATDWLRQLLVDRALYVGTAAEWALAQLDDDWASPDATDWELGHLVGYDDRALEQLVAQLWSQYGYETELIQETRTDGFDVAAEDGAERSLIRIERYNPYKHAGSITVETVQRTAGTLAMDEFDRVVVVTNSHFSSAAVGFAARTDRVRLVDGGQLCDLLGGEGFATPSPGPAATGARTTARRSS